ncbi:hypothetical protein [Pseudomonas purpurea]|uniref:hypothetical protein n=1 Tax=Pseudomonas purpurea TaxID=3136737 RepID=UPI003263A7A0
MATTNNQGLTRLLLLGCAFSSVISLPVFADGNGVIVLQRDVQPTPIGRSRDKDPYPNTVSANPSARVVQTTGTELNDRDFAGVSSGSSIINRTVVPNGNGNAGLNSLTNANGMPGMGAGHGGGGGSEISGTINRSISAGLSPLTNMGGK